MSKSCDFCGNWETECSSLEEAEGCVMYKPVKRVAAIPESINHPPHYGGESDPYEAIKVIEAWRLGFNLGNCVKYIRRAGEKDDNLILDLEKAKWYLEREIGRLRKLTSSEKESPSAGEPEKLEQSSKEAATQSLQQLIDTPVPSTSQEKKNPTSLVSVQKALERQVLRIESDSGNLILAAGLVVSVNRYGQTWPVEREVLRVVVEVNP